jgi:general nucleoside transport system ATP-binding protein
MTGSYQRLGFTLPGLDSPIRSLSGGNLQRAVVARELAHDPRLIIALYPTRGLDVMSAHAVRELLRTVTDSGTGVLLISEDLEELADMSDRLLVMFGGTVAGEFPRGAWSAEAVGHLMTGSGQAAGKARA